MSDPRGSKVSCANQGGFAGSFSVLWNHLGVQMESDQTSTYTNGFTKQIDLMPYASGGTISTGDSCWLRWHMVGGPNHDSGDNFTFDSGSDANVAYSITGGVLNPSFHQQAG